VVTQHGQGKGEEGGGAHLMAQSAFFMTAGTVSMAERRCSFSALSRT